MTDPLVALLSSDDCQPLLKRLTAKLARGEALSGRCRLKCLSQPQCDAIESFCNSPSRQGAISIDLQRLDRVVTATGRFPSLAALVERCADREIVNQRRLREESQRKWDQVVALGVQLASLDSAVLQCVESLCASGNLRKVAGGDPALATALLEQSFELLARLPIDPVPTPVFAAKYLGDAHALDPPRPLARLLLRLIAARFGSSAPASARDRRDVLERAGLVSDELSSTVLALNLPAVGDGVADRMLRCHAEEGMPCRLSFRHLRLWPPAFRDFALAQQPQAAQRARLFVCENPSVVAAAADELGRQCAPLMCVEGNPSVACMRLLQMLCEAGYSLCYHGDFDWGGLRIANRIFRRFRFTPWRYAASQYEPTDAHRRALKPPAVDAEWDSELRRVMQRGGWAIDEESCIQVLLHDLRRL